MGLFKKKESTATKSSTNTDTDMISDKQAELIAVISAAIMAYESEAGESTSLHFRKIDRAAGVIPNWGAAGIKDQMDTRKI